MKYLFLVFTLLAPMAGAQCIVTLDSGEYKLKTGGEIKANQCAGRPCLNQRDGKAAQDAAVQACKCRVDLIQPVVVGKCASSSSSATSRASSSVSSAAPLTTITWGRPTCREPDAGQTSCDTLLASEIQEYRLRCDGRPVETIKPTGDREEYKTAYIAPGTKCSVSAVDTDNQESVQAPIIDTRQG